MTDRYIAVFHIRDDDRRRWWVIDTKPTKTAECGTTVAECLGEGKALEVARALNRGADVEAAVDAVTTTDAVGNQRTITFERPTYAGGGVRIPRQAIDVLLARLPPFRESWTDEERIAVDSIHAAIRAEEEPF